MKRFITYLYDCEGGTKGKGTGFVRVDIRGRDVRMEVHVRNAGRFQGKGNMYLITGNDSVRGLYVGDITIISGSGDEDLRFSYKHMFQSGMDFSDVIGMAIRYSEGYIASNWQEKECPKLTKGTFEVISTQKPENRKESAQIEAAENDPGSSEAVEVTKLQEEKASEIPDIKKKEEPPEDVPETGEAYEDLLIEETEKPTYRKIQLSHIRDLPPKNRYLCNNSFLLHGFYNYNFLILKKEKEKEGEKWSLGVPGVYEQPEKMMAGIFGFSDFEPREGGELKEGVFGTWFLTLEM